MKTLRSILLLSCVLSALLVAEEPAAMYQPDVDIEAKVEALLGQMTLYEKIDMISGRRIDEIKGLERIGLPPMYPSDGPMGLRIYGPATAFPASIAQAATWDVDQVGEVAAAVAREYKAYGKNVLLGPCVNISRAPQGGRNFESYGEDPFLAARLAVSYTRAVQDEGIIACVKHFACNNQEFERKTIDVKVGERALREIYLPAFEAAIIEGGSWSIMSAYNQLNGQYASANPWLLTTVLKEEWGFPGFVMSDWNAIHETVGTLNAGMDLEMPLGTYLGGRDVMAALERGDVNEKRIDDAVRRMLRAMVAMGLDNTSVPDGAELATTEHQQLAREMAANGLVLLKNERQVLPLNPNSARVALIGPGAKRLRWGGGGSSRVSPTRKPSPLAALTEALGTTGAVTWAEGFQDESDVVPIESRFLTPPADVTWAQHGLYAEYHDAADFAVTPIVRRVDPNIDFNWQFPSPASGRQREVAAIRWEGFLTPDASGDYEIKVYSQHRMRVELDGRPIIDKEPNERDPVTGHRLNLRAGKAYAIKVEFVGPGSDVTLGWRRVYDDAVAQAAEVAAAADVAVVVAGWSDANERESIDRESLSLPADQVRVIRAVAAANPRTVVVLHAGGAIVSEDWLDDVAGVIMAWYPGQEGGHALADVLTGAVNPSGKLPVTFPKRWEDHSAYGNYPGSGGVVRYDEGIMVGYRHADTAGIAPRFEFGFGLSYTAFKLGELSVSAQQIHADDEVVVRVPVTNTGAVAGAEVVQLYVEDPESRLERPTRELKGFVRVELAPGETGEVVFRLSRRDWSFYDVDAEDWVAEPGLFRLRIGTSSRDLRRTTEIELKDL